MKLSKQEARRLLKNKLGSLSSEIWLEKNKNLSLRVSDFLNSLKSIHCIGVYAPLNREADWTGALNELSIETAFPAFSELEGMDFRQTKLEELEVRHDFGVAIRCPKNSAKVVIPDLILVPGLGFSKKGERLGKGGGFYDRYLENFKGLKIGISLEEQVSSDIPTEGHDQKMDALVTDERTLIFSSKLKGEIK